MIYVEADGPTILTYDPSRHHFGSKFLYFVNMDGEDTLLISGKDLQHKYILDDYNRRQPTAPLNQAHLRGAGVIKFGKVESWYSAGFDLKTPEELKPRITSLLQG